MRNFFFKLAIRKRILLLHTNKNLMKSKKTTYYKRLATKIVADWELKVVDSRTEPCLQCDFSYNADARVWPSPRVVRIALIKENLDNPAVSLESLRCAWQRRMTGDQPTREINQIWTKFSFFLTPVRGPIS